MKPLLSSFSGHVKNGVVVLDPGTSLPEGLSVRIEPIEENSPTNGSLLKGMQTLFTQWSEEDGQLSNEEADRLQIALEQNRGVTLRNFELE
jgi:hypothetical protein